jgi:hypothetical protein
MPTSFTQDDGAGLALIEAIHHLEAGLENLDRIGLQEAAAHVSLGIELARIALERFKLETI